MARVGIIRSMIYRLMGEGRFPRSQSLGLTQSDTLKAWSLLTEESDNLCRSEVEEVGLPTTRCFVRISRLRAIPYARATQSSGSRNGIITFCAFASELH